MTRTTAFRIRTTTLAAALLLAFAGSAGAADLARADKNFLEKAAEANHTEINASKIALEKSTMPAVKEFANAMIADHGKTGDEARALATAKGVKLPDDPSTMQKAKITMLSKLNGANFDKQYAKIVGVNAHEDTIKLFRKASTDAKDPDVKAFAAKTLPALEHHLEMAKALKATTDSAKGNSAAANSAARSRSQDMPAPGTNAGTGATGAMMGTPSSTSTTTSTAAHSGTATASMTGAHTNTATKSK